MKSHFCNIAWKYWLPRVIFGAVGAFLLGCLVVSVAVYIAVQRGTLKTTLEQLLNAKLAYQVDKAQWDWEHPVLELSNIQIVPNGSTKAAIRARQVKVVFDLWSSATHLRPATTEISIERLRLRMRQSATGLYYVVGWPSSHPAKQIHWSKVWAWLQPQASVQFHHAQILAEDLNGKRTSRSRLSFHWNRIRPGKHELSVQLTGSQEHQKQAYAIIHIVFSGSLILPTTFDADFYGAVQGNNIGYILANFSLLGMQWRQGSGIAQVWGQWRQGHVARAHGLFNLRQVKVANHRLDVEASIQSFMQNVLWTGSATGWQVLMNPYHYKKGQLIEDPSQAIMISRSQSGQGAHWQAYFGEVQVDLLSRLMQVLPGISPAQRAWLQGAKPEGELKHFYASADQSGGAWQQFSVISEFKDLTLNKWQGSPAVKSMSGQVHMTSDRGLLSFNSGHFYLSDNGWFPVAWPASSVQGQITWQHGRYGDWDVAIDHVLYQNANITSMLVGTARVPESVSDWRDTVLSLQWGMKVSHAEKVFRSYLPSKILDRGTDVWIKQAIVNFPSMQGTVLIQGKLNQIPYAQNQGTLLAGLSIPKADLRPEAGWPIIHHTDIKARFDGGLLNINALGGSAYGVNFVKTQVNTHPDRDNKTVIQVKGQVKGMAKFARLYLLHTPVSDDFQRYDRFVRLHGPFQLDLNMRFPMVQNPENNIAGQLKLKNNSITFADSPLSFSSVDGVVSFDNEIVHAKRITAKLWGRPATLDINSYGKSSSTKGVVHKVNLQGSVDLSQLLHDLNISFTKNVFGVTSFKAVLEQQQQSMLFTLTSDLKGVTINLPAPFSKQENTVLPAKFQVNLSQSGKLPVALQVGGMLSANLLFKQQGQRLAFYSGQVLLGLHNAVTLPKSAGLYVDGIMSYVSVKAWVEAIRPYFQSLSQTHTPHNTNQLKRIKLHVGELNIYDTMFSDTVVQIAPGQSGWFITLDGKQIKGKVILPQNVQSGELRANLDYLRITREESSAKSKEMGKAAMKQRLDKASKYLTAAYLQQLPALDVTVRDLYWQDRSLGAVHWLSDPVFKGIAIKKLALENENFNANISAHIVAKGKQDAIAIKGDFNGHDWGETFSVLGYPDFMRKGRGKVSVNVNWLGHLFDIDFATLNGFLGFHLSSGALLSVNPGFARILGLTDIGSLFQQLKLSAEDVGNKGLAFDQLDGHYLVHDGIASTHRVSLSGPALDLLMQGEINLVKETLDQTIVVIPHVGGGVAIAAGILGGPIAAVAAWVGEKILTNTVLKDKGIVFKVTGSWDDPKVENKGSNFQEPSS